MASSKKNKNTTPQDQALAAKRVAFVKSKPELAPAEARTRFFVQTRAAELQAKGVEVTKQKRQELRQKFASGGVQRQGFYTPADIARAAARNTGTGGGTTGGSTGVPSGTPSSRPQDLADYKNTVYSNLDKENMARRPVAPKKPDFDKYSMNPAEFLDSPFAKGVVSGAKFVGGSIKSVGESFAASTINPVLNIPKNAMANIQDIKEEGIKRVFWVKGGENYEAAKNNPRFREAGIVEKSLNIAPLEAGFAAGNKFAQIVGPKIAKTKFGQNLIANSTVRNVGQVVRGTEEYVQTALSKLGKGGKAGTVDLATGAYQAPIKTAAKNAAKDKAAANIVTGADDYVKAAVKNYGKGAKSGTVDLATGAYQAPIKAAAKKASTKASKSFPSGKNEVPSFLKGADDVPSFLKPEAALKTKATPAKPVAPKATPKTGKQRFEATRTQARKDVNASNWKDPNNRFVDGYDDTPIDFGNRGGSFDFMESSSRYSTARRPTKVADAAPAPKATPAKTTKPKARAKAGFKAKVNEIKSTPAPVSTKSSFKSQAEYSTWLKGGGKETLRNMSQAQRDVFLKANDKFVKGAANKAQQAAAEQAKTTARALKTEKLYKGARPELQAKFNKALLNRQQRQLLAKIAPKK
jgi:hypothetical protein